MRRNDPYEYADDLYPELEREIRLVLANAALRVCSFDQINQLQLRGVVGSSFSDIYTRLSIRLKRIIRRTYKSFGIHLTAEEELALLKALLHKSDPVTGYKLQKEINRKRDRMIEAILARPGKQEIRTTISHELAYVLLMAHQYLDIATDDSRLGAMERNGIQQVQWISEHDEKTCRTCRELDGKVFDINRAPDKQHYRCRCYLIPYDSSQRSEGK